MPRESEKSVEQGKLGYLSFETPHSSEQECEDSGGKKTSREDQPHSILRRLSAQALKCVAPSFLQIHAAKGHFRNPGVRTRECQLEHAIRKTDASTIPLDNRKYRIQVVPGDMDVVLGAG